MAFNFKEGGDANNYATNVVVGGASDSDAVAAGGAGVLGGQGGAGIALGRFADSSATNVNVQEEFALGTTDNTVASGNAGSILS